jgi:hypothetical protein
MLPRGMMNALILEISTYDLLVYSDFEIKQ